MSNLTLVIQREYMSRVKKKSFIIMTFLGPLLMAGLITGTIWVTLQSEQNQKILVIDDTHSLFVRLKTAGQTVEFVHSETELDLQQAKKVLMNDDELTGVIHFPYNIINQGPFPVLYAKKQPSITAVRNIERQVEQILEEYQYEQNNIKPAVYDKFKRTIRLSTLKLSENGEESEVNSAKAIVGFIFSIAIYLFIFLYGAMVMRGVIEEKTSRIVEVIISSVRPFQLMLGKIIGIAMVALTQVAMWIVLTTVFILIGQYFIADALLDSAVNQQMTTEMMGEMQGEFMQAGKIDENQFMQALLTTNWSTMLTLFILFFIGGYLLYASLFAAIGAAVDQEADTQQFMLPITIPLIFGFVAAEATIANPEGAVALWTSMIPFTSPIVMLVRAAMGVGNEGIPVWQVWTSLGILYATFLATTYLAGRIYRTGILMYGKKVSWKELWKWVRYSG